MWNEALRLVSPEKEDLALMLDLLAAIRNPMNPNVGNPHPIKTDTSSQEQICAALCLRCTSGERYMQCMIA